jgi:enoyl-CoA hydratase
MPSLKTHLSDSILIVTVSRPEALNALNADVMDSLYRIMQETYQRQEVRGIILTGEGEKAFVAGADIAELSNLSPQEALILAQKGQKLFKMIEDCPKPVVCAVNGFALGGGCELAMSCHIRIASENAKFGQPEVNLGIIPGYGGTQRLTQLVGRGKSLELLMTGDMISAQEALSIGLVNQVVKSKAELLELAQKVMLKILAKAPRAIANIIKSVNAGFEFEQRGYDAEAAGFSECFGTNDFREGTSAFLEKRKPVFTGL